MSSSARNREGKSTKLRFLWLDVDTTHPRWEQPYQHPATGEWETNWSMTFAARSG